MSFVTEQNKTRLVFFGVEAGGSYNLISLETWTHNDIIRVIWTGESQSGVMEGPSIYWTNGIMMHSHCVEDQKNLQLFHLENIYALFQGLSAYISTKTGKTFSLLV